MTLMWWSMSPRKMHHLKVISNEYSRRAINNKHDNNDNNNNNIGGGVGGNSKSFP
jgi:hypothetical protein